MTCWTDGNDQNTNVWNHSRETVNRGHVIDVMNLSITSLCFCCFITLLTHYDSCVNSCSIFSLHETPYLHTKCFHILIKAMQLGQWSHEAEHAQIAFTCSNTWQIMREHNTIKPNPIFPTLNYLKLDVCKWHKSTSLKLTQCCTQIKSWAMSKY